jgi:hypothetical protein
MIMNGVSQGEWGSSLFLSRNRMRFTRDLKSLPGRDLSYMKAGREPVETGMGHA